MNVNSVSHLLKYIEQAKIIVMAFTQLDSIESIVVATNIHKRKKCQVKNKTIYVTIYRSLATA